MYPATISFFGLALAGLAYSQESSTVTLFIPGADTQALVGSIVGSDATATTYVIQCPPGGDSVDCGFYRPITLTESPDRAKYTFPPRNDGDSASLTGYIDCAISGTTKAVCTYASGAALHAAPSTDTYTGSELPYMPVVITAGPAETPTPVSPITTDSAQPTGTDGAAPAAPTSSAGMPAVTGHAGWALGGAAMALAIMG